MKKNIIAIALLSFGMMSCGDSFLDVAPTDKLSDETFWKSEKDADLGLAGCYRGWENYTNIVFLDAAADNGYDQFNYSIQPIGNGQILPTSGWGAWYDGDAGKWFPYSRIRKYNNFLEKVDNIDMDEARKEKYKAEVRFLRAYDYFNKVMFYGDVPLVTEVIADPQSSALARTPKAEVEAFIIKELTEIAAKLPVQNTIESRGHITQGAAFALKARLELYQGKYAEAMVSAKKVIDMSCYELFPTYEEMFWPESESTNKEAILNIQYIKDEYNSMLPQLNLPAVEGGWSALGASWKLIESYQMANGKAINEVGSGYDDNNPFKNRDPRMNMTVLCPGELYNGRYYNTLDKFINSVKNLDFHEEAAASRTGLLVKKYIKPMSVENMNNYDGNVMVIRLAEMYITFAECAVKTGKDTDLALQYINKIRNRAGIELASALTEDLVRYERRAELAFEGLRYFDIKRWNMGSQALNGPLYGSREGSVDPATGKVTWKNTYIKLEDRIFQQTRNYLLPIPQAELDRNPQMTQNPGY
nr:RagB/SusD family nutrient uptake outer membrane protein [uncultured Macellibacteroides sp.]